MKWFFGLNEDSPYFSEYGDMIRVAVETARRHTRLEPCFVYDGRPCALTRWLEARGAAVIPARWRWLDEYRRVVAETGYRELEGFAAGVFLRTEIPSLCAARGWGGKTVLYTDCDIMFTGDPEPLFPGLRGSFFGAGPEFEPENTQNMNSGVMLMRVDALLGVEDAFQRFIRANMADCARYTDQFAYQYFFRHGWKPLPAALNWKPYWGESAEARILHFHGPKPFVRAMLDNRTGGTEVQRSLARGAYAHYCDIWEEILGSLSPLK